MVRDVIRERFEVRLSGVSVGRLPRKGLLRFMTL